MSMNGRAGRSAIALFLSLVFISALLFIFLEDKALSKTQLPAEDRTYDLYRKVGDRLIPVSPSELDHAATAAINGAAQRDPDEFPPADRYLTINLNAVCVNKTDCTTLETGDAFVVTYELDPATKSVILSDGSLQTIYLLPSRVDTYVAVRTPNNNLLFMDRFSTVTNQYYWKPVAFTENMPITTLAGSLVGTLMRGNFAPGYYTIYVAMVHPGQSVYSDPSTYISNLATLQFYYNFAQPPQP